MSKWQWRYVLRTAKNILLTWQDEEFRFNDMLEVTQAGDMENIPNDCPEGGLSSGKYRKICTLAIVRSMRIQYFALAVSFQKLAGIRRELREGSLELDPRSLLVL